MDSESRLRFVLWAVGASFLFSGAALITHILASVSLRLAVGFMALLPLITFWVCLRRLSAEDRKSVFRRLRTGTMSGLIATGSYDLSKFLLSTWDASPYNPFEVIRIFGSLLIGPGAQSWVVYTAGVSFHLLNGTCFAVAYYFLLGKFGIVAAVLWGLFLECFQLALYPGWLNVAFYREFVTISASSHIVYGLALGFSCQQLETRLGY